jgi:hypothetical protein
MDLPVKLYIVYKADVAKFLAFSILVEVELNPLKQIISPFLKLSINLTPL